MRKKNLVVILSTALAILVAACSESSSSSAIQESEQTASEEIESSSSEETESSSSSEEESSSSATEEGSSSSIEEESSSSAEEILSSSSSEEISSSSTEAIPVDSVSSSSEITLESSSSESASEFIEESSSSETIPEITEESSSSETIPEITEESSSSESIPDYFEESSSSEEIVSSSSIEEMESSSSEEFVSSSSEDIELPLSEECLAIRNVRDTFPQVTELLKCIRKSEKVAFILRHSERDKSKSGSKEFLNDNGRKLAFEFGEKLSDVEDIYFMHTRVYRTMETILKIAEGKGQSFSESVIPFSEKEGLDHLETADLEESYMIRNNDKFQECRSRFGWGWSPYSYAAYEEDVTEACQEGFYDADDRLAELVDTYFTYEKMHNVTIAISHDNLLVPFAIAASNRQVHLQFHEHEGNYNYWLNYLTGIAIIADNEGNTIILPATAMNDPYLRVFPDDN